MPTPVATFLRISLPLAFSNTLTQAARTVLSVVGPFIAYEFSLSAGQLGLLAASMFGGYCLAQLPVGLALDLFGARRVQFVLAMVAAVGFAAFALSSDMAGFVAARILIGVGVSAGLIGMIKGNSQWWPPTRMAAVIGLAMMVGALGSIGVTWPANAVLPFIGWRGIFWVLAGFALCVGLWIWVSVRDRPPGIAAPPAARRLVAEIDVIRQIYRSGLFWRVAPSIGLLTLLNFTYQGLWAGPWLRDVAGMGADRRAVVMLLYALGLLFGSMLSGQASSRLQARGYHPLLVPYACAGGVALAQAGLMFGPTRPVVVTALWVIFPFCAACGPVGYTVVSQMFPLGQVGRVTTAINALSVGGVFALQSIIGFVLDLWPKTIEGHWDPKGYSVALGLGLCLQIVAAGWAVLGRAVVPKPAHVPVGK
jgi:MFS family permease